MRIAGESEFSGFDTLLGQHHYLGAGQPVGDYLRQIVEREGQPMALLAWGPACYALKDRDHWISWSAPQRIERLKLIAQNRRSSASPQGPSPSGVLPLQIPQMDSLLDVFRQAPDPRDANTVYRTDPVLTLIAMAWLAGRREIARFAATLTQPQRRRLGSPLKKGTRAFRKVPGYGVFYQVLTRMDPESFAQLLSGWLQRQASSLPQALALDGKMIRNHLGLLTLAHHEDGAPRKPSPFTTSRRARSVANSPPPKTTTP